MVPSASIILLYIHPVHCLTCWFSGSVHVQKTRSIIWDFRQWRTIFQINNLTESITDERNRRLFILNGSRRTRTSTPLTKENAWYSIYVCMTCGIWKLSIRSCCKKERLLSVSHVWLHPVTSMLMVTWLAIGSHNVCVVHPINRFCRSEFPFFMHGPSVFLRAP